MNAFLSGSNVTPFILAQSTAVGMMVSWITFLGSLFLFCFVDAPLPMSRNYPQSRLLPVYCLVLIMSGWH